MRFAKQCTLNYDNNILDLFQPSEYNCSLYLSMFAEYIL